MTHPPELVKKVVRAMGMVPLGLGRTFAESQAIAALDAAAEWAGKQDNLRPYKVEKHAQDQCGVSGPGFMLRESEPKDVEGRAHFWCSRLNAAYAAGAASRERVTIDDCPNVQRFLDGTDTGDDIQHEAIRRELRTILGVE